MTIELETIVTRYGDRSVGFNRERGSRGCWWLDDKRLFISRGPLDEYEVFIAGEEPTFGPMPPLRNLEVMTAVLSTGQSMAALKISVPDRGESLRLAAHLGYELHAQLEHDPKISNAALLGAVRPFLQIVGEASFLSTEEQIGLVGELLLLQRLVARAEHRGVGAHVPLGAWIGHSKNALRDFLANGVAIECKATGRSSREHHIGSIAQLEPAFEGEALHLFSVGAKRDPSGDVSLPVLVDQLEAKLDPSARVELRRKLGEYGAVGYRTEDAPFYRRQPGFLLTRFPPRLFVVDDTVRRLRLASFVDGMLPAHVKDVAYVLDLSSLRTDGNPLSVSAEVVVLDRLLGQEPLSAGA